MKFTALALVLLILTACCSERVIYKPVETINYLKCPFPAIDHPVWPTQDLTPADPLAKQVRSMLAENELRRAYEIKMEAAIEACK